jgi:hypothetical protein
MTTENYTPSHIWIFVPKAFYQDAWECGCDVPPILSEKRQGKGYTIMLDALDPRYADLENRAEYYADSGMAGGWDQGAIRVVAAAKAFLKARKKFDYLFTE